MKIKFNGYKWDIKHDPQTLITTATQRGGQGHTVSFLLLKEFNEENVLAELPYFAPPKWRLKARDTKPSGHLEEGLPFGQVVTPNAISKPILERAETSVALEMLAALGVGAKAPKPYKGAKPKANPAQKRAVAKVKPKLEKQMDEAVKVKTQKPRKSKKPAWVVAMEKRRAAKAAKAGNLDVITAPAGDPVLAN